MADQGTWFSVQLLCANYVPLLIRHSFDLNKLSNLITRLPLSNPMPNSVFNFVPFYRQWKKKNHFGSSQIWTSVFQLFSSLWQPKEGKSLNSSSSSCYFSSSRIKNFIVISPYSYVLPCHGAFINICS